jgi:hypothetical protein
MLKSTSTLILLSLVVVNTIAHNCNHGHEKRSITFIESTAPKESSSPKGRALESAYESIRIHADYSYIPPHNQQVKDYIENQLMASAISYYQSILKVVRLEEKLKVDAMCDTVRSPLHLTREGVDADLVLLVMADYYPFDSFLALSFPCGLAETNNRPVYGTILFNLYYLNTESTTDHEQNLATTLHEMAHILGFSDYLYEYFVDPETNTKLANPVKTKMVNGVQTYILDIEPLTSRLREYFGCSTLEGAYLENQGDAGSAGSHFERKVFMNEFMTASAVPDAVISVFFLDFLKGTGWYDVDYSMAEPFNWGKGKGCSFLDGPCVDENANPNFEEFCSPLTEVGCTFTGRAIAACGTSPEYMAADPLLYASFDYWQNQTVVFDYFADNCPYYDMADYTWDCENPSNQAYASLNEEVYGGSSRCFTGSLSNTSPQGRSAFCFPTKCEKNGNGFTLEITLGSKTITCTKKESIIVSELNGQIDCPDPDAYCKRANPTYCDKGCSGRGTCVSGKCKCPDGWEGADCAIRVYKDNCDRCENESRNKACYGDLCRCNPMTQNC